MKCTFPKYSSNCYLGKNFTHYVLQTGKVFWCIRGEQFSEKRKVDLNFYKLPPRSFAEWKVRQNDQLHHMNLTKMELQFSELEIKLMMKMYGSVLVWHSFWMIVCYSLVWKSFKNHKYKPFNLSLTKSKSISLQHVN